MIIPGGRAPGEDGRHQRGTPQGHPGGRGAGETLGVEMFGMIIGMIWVNGL